MVTQIAEAFFTKPSINQISKICMWSFCFYSFWQRILNLRSKWSKSFRSIRFSICSYNVFIISSSYGWGPYRKKKQKKKESEFSANVLIEIMLAAFFIYLALAFSIGSSSFSVFTKKIGLVFLLKLKTMLTKNLLIIPASSSYCLEY